MRCISSHHPLWWERHAARPGRPNWALSGRRPLAHRRFRLAVEPMAATGGAARAGLDRWFDLDGALDPLAAEIPAAGLGAGARSGIGARGGVSERGGVLEDGSAGRADRHAGDAQCALVATGSPNPPFYSDTRTFPASAELPRPASAAPAASTPQNGARGRIAGSGRACSGASVAAPNWAAPRCRRSRRS